MPPKKKRGSGGQLQNQVTEVAFKRTSAYSTRSTKQATVKPEKVQKGKKTNTTMPKPSAKATAKKGKAPSKAKKASGTRKRKSEVKAVESEEKNDNSKDIECLLSELENDGGNDFHPQPIELVKLEEDAMETVDIQNLESETSQIAAQLENLNVVSDETSYSVVVDSSEETQENVVAEVASLDAEIEEVVELDNYTEYTVECVTEDFVPLAENTEVVIDEEVECNELPDIQEDQSNKIDILYESEEIKEKIEEPSQPLLEETHIIETKQEEKDVQNDQSDSKVEVTKAKKKVVRRDPREAKKAPVKKKPRPKQPKKESSIDKTEEVRRSSRIKSINVLKQRSKGHGLVKQTKFSENESNDNSNASTPDIDKCADPQNIFAGNENENNKPVKVKSRWRRSSELEMNVLTPAAVVMQTCGDSEKIAEVNNILDNKPTTAADDEEVAKRLKQFVHLKENQYLTDRMTCKEAKKMTCDCFLMQEESERGEWGCGEDCLNRLLMIECGSFCPVGDRCTNKKFQKLQFAPVEVFKTEKKGLGLRAAANIPYGEFIIEYVGEVLDHEEFDSRADDYSNDNNRHYYFMALRADAIIDATMKGNISRFINHSCEPNAETQKWTVNGELRIGFFSTRTILAGEEITFDYRFERYGKEAQKCYCEAPTCRGWLGEEPEDEDDEEEGSEEEDEEEVEHQEQIKEEVKEKTDEIVEPIPSEEGVVKVEEIQESPKKERKKKSPKKKPRKDIFEDLDQLDEEIEMLVTTGLKNQAHTLKLSRLMVRAKEPAQRAKLLRVLRRGELPCRRLFLDYHGLRLMHGYMIDAQHLTKSEQKHKSLRLEMLQTLATLPIPNKTMLQDSKVLPTVKKWSTTKEVDLPMDSDSSSPQTDQDPSQTPIDDDKKEDSSVVKSNDVEMKVETQDVKTEENEEIRKSVGMDFQGKSDIGDFSNTHGKQLADEISQIFQDDSTNASQETKVSKVPEVKSEEPNYEEEITALAQKLLEEWSNLKEVFKIPKKERIEQMKEHEREANRGYIAGLGMEDAEKKSESRYRILKRYRSMDKMESSLSRKNMKLEDRYMGNYPRLGKFERRKMFAIQVEQREEERRRKQREMWRQHEQHCILLGTDPRLTAPFDPNRGYQCIWNPQIGQWQNYPIPNPNLIFNTQTPNVPSLPAMNVPPPNSNTNYPFLQPNLHAPTMMPPPPVNTIHPLPSLPYQEEVKKEEDYSQVKFMGPIPPPVKLPPKWKCAKDKYGRPYYYHIKIRKSQWEPPPLPQPKPQEEPEYSSSSTSSSDTSSLSSDTSTDESESEDDLDDAKLLSEVRKQMEKPVKLSFPMTPSQSERETSETALKSPTEEDKEENIPEITADTISEEEQKAKLLSVEDRLKDIFKEEPPPTPGKKRRAGLVSEIIISPRTEEDRLQFREDLKRYKMNKEKLRKEKEMIVQQSKKHTKDKRHKTTIKLKMKEMNDSNSETAKKIKETFRSSMATVVVAVLNSYRKPDCKEGRITNTEDFKHLARKLTHFVMLKEMKHIEKIEDLVCTENVKGKAKEYIRKYMSKFGENYQKRNDEPDF